MMDLMTQMDKAKELTQFALTHHAISKEDKEDFTGWLHTLNSNQDAAARLRGGAQNPPQVTISGVSGNIVQYNALNSPERTSRPWRSNSLTPPSNLHNLSPSPTSEWTYQARSGRSHSLTFENGIGGGEGMSPAASASTLDEKELEEMVKNLPEGSGMREIREWLKSLRLHKYTKILLEYTYEELLNLNDETLEKRNVTLGARGKILKNIGHIRDRHNALRVLSNDLSEVSQNNDSEGLVKVLRELESIVLMPLKPYHPMISEENVPGQIFDILKSISTEIFVKEYSNHEVVTVFVCLLEKCLKREAYNSSQKQLITGWLQKLKTLWNPPHIKKATDYKKRPLSNSMGRRSSSFHRNNQNFKNFSGNLMPSQPENDEQPSAGCFSPRRSMPEIKPNHQIMSHMKRNSYQEESKIHLDGFSHHMNYMGSYRNSFSSGSSLRRESGDSGYLMSLPESRRDSEVDSYQYNRPDSIRRDSEDFFKMRSGYSGKPYSSPRRDSGSSEDFLTVESALLRNSSSGSGHVKNLGVIGSILKTVPGSMSSGCASDGSTDSLLEQDLHNLSLAVTQQALE